MWLEMKRCDGVTRMTEGLGVDQCECRDQLLECEVMLDQTRKDQMNYAVAEHWRGP